ncbi:MULTISPECIES: LysR family transcriptional regulator [unclassified Agarivorans]|uniref:LysR family transcriptional regulator n=1 Tax=unclassified Agarivorans TaxID=2636026 RepID=UPI003D7F0014
MDKLDAMRSFIEVANTQSFTKAAEQLNLSRLQVSRHVQEIEAWLKQRLLHRTTRKVSLSSAGETALRHCEQIIAQTVAMQLQAQQQIGRLMGSIRLTAPVAFSQNILLDVVTQFCQRHPEVNIDIVASDRFTQLVDERVDIAFRYTQAPDEQLIARRLMRVDSVICAAPAYLKQFGRPSDLNALKQHNCLLHLGHKQWEFIRHQQSYKVEVSGTLQANEMGLLLNAALKGRGIILLPCDQANPLIRAGKLQPILNEYHLPQHALWAVYLSRSYQSPLVRQFIDFVAEQWQQDILRLDESELQRSQH